MYSCPFRSTITNDVESSTKRMPRASARTAVVASEAPLSRANEGDTGVAAFNITHTRPLTETTPKAQGRLTFKLNMFGRRWGRHAFRIVFSYRVRKVISHLAVSNVRQL